MALPAIELTIEPRAKTLTASLRRRQAGSGHDPLVLSAGSYAPESATPDLLLALDQLAWEVRLALGEAAPQPKHVAAITSNHAQVVLAVQDAIELMRDGAFASAHRTLQRARQRDGGAPFVLDQLAAVELLRGDSSAAERICREALGYEARVSATVQHRLLRTLLMARSAREPQQAQRFDAELITLATVARRERPHDEEPMWTEALANNFTAKFAAARPQLENLHERQPENAFVPYHLGWACLALGDASAAKDHLATAALRLPAPWVLLPRAIALYEAEQHEELQSLLEDVVAEFARDPRNVLCHQVLRMQAAHAILRGNDDRAREFLLEDLRWLLANPLALGARVGELAETGWVLARMGGPRELPAILAAMQKQHVGKAVADASAFVSAMHQVKATGQRATATERALDKGGDNAWSALLAAYAHERRGEVGDMQNELSRAARLSDSPMTKALLAKSLRAVGKLPDAERLHQTLRRELRTLHLRRTCQHPLFGPELAYAFTLR